MKCCDVKTNSLKKYHKEFIKNSMGKMHVDVVALRVNKLLVLLFLRSHLTKPQKR